MKRICLLLTVLGMALGMNAQIFVGGTLGIASSKTTDMDRITEFVLSPYVGYTLTERIDVGVNVGYGYAEQGETSLNRFLFGAFGRYAFYETGDFRFFGQANLSYLNSKLSGMNSKSGFGFDLAPGVSYSINDNWDLLAVMSLLSYTHYKGESTTSFSIDPTNISVGIQYHF